MTDVNLPWSDPASDPMGDVLQWARRAYGQGMGPIVPDLCGLCAERWIETPTGLAKCPRCYPKKKTA